MLKIRFQRTGRKNDPAFRVVVTESTNSTKTGNHVDVVGSYHPKTKHTVLNAESIKHWLSKGAQASGTVHNLLVSKGIIEGKKVNVLPKKTPIVKEEEPAEEAPKAEDAPAPSSEEAEASTPSEEEASAKPVEEELKAEEPAQETPTEEKSEEQKPAE
ncbi:30S ribosomal protein S16 [Candidatus Kaiserbacteria bacterium CG10_big_fil_rev_8_21_14_0_10_45_20]|uniref:Small ribosomal subunit protein bS16 n=1 Tax=Candidatus Kaiserbacteria bacterium CG10_big_fil_rev_8_21_14_0_10_45_20 TaxID=1974607 RepID=A0A2H0UGE5_9BACT|nr:MAG: 30S ribosomal protein S16 [Candidatus Kaiserbacteria bacterium CG10_big_fil_rev_8_21_14_0_10_45_20]